MNKYLFYVFTLLFLPLKIVSQGIANPYTATEDNLKSPQVHLLKQFVDHPVDLSRGLVDIAIPLYDIKFANKTIPISVMFHSSGLKANATEFGMLGLKWALNAGGFISREVRGIPDEVRAHKQGINNLAYTPDWMTLYGGGADKGHANNNTIFKNDDLQYIGMSGVHSKYEDTAYDIFTFSLPNGQSGKFILKDNNGDKSASFMPYKPYKLNNPTVEYFGGIYPVAYTKFEITDDEGYIYTFGKNDTGTYYYEKSPSSDYINSWQLVSITSPNKKDIIKFNYVGTTTLGNSPLTPVIINDQLDDFVNYFRKEECQGARRDSPLFSALESTLYDFGGYFIKNYNEPPYENNNVLYLSRIMYNDLNINFTYSNNNQTLNKIEISKDNLILKKIGFDVQNYSYLNAVNIQGSSNEIIEKYTFDYYHLDKFPSMLDKLSNKADYWGYYNSEVENVIVKDTIDIFFWYPSCLGSIKERFRREIGSGNNRYSNAEDMKIGMIKSITYPTGGISTFDYDANQYRDLNVIRTCGGLRIKSIIDKDKNGKELKKREFTYGQNEDGIGEIPIYLKPDINIPNIFEEAATTYYVDDTSIYYDGETGTPYFPLDQGYGTYRTRYITGSFPGIFYTFLDKLVSYDKITEYIGDSNNNIGKIENYYANNIPLHYEYEFDTRYFKFQKNKPIIDPSNFWTGNHLSKKIEYKNTNGQYSKVKETNFSYEEKKVDEFYDLSIFTFKNFVGYDIRAISEGLTDIPIATKELEFVRANPGEFFGYKTQKYTVGVENLAQTTEKLYLKNDSIVQTTVNQYDLAKPTFLTEKTTISSKGESITQKFSYPFNINAGVYSQMTTANVISPVVESLTLNNNKVTGSALLTYKKSDDNFVPDKNYAAQLSNPVPFSGFTAFNGTSKDSRYSTDPENTYDAFDDHGNPIQMTTKGKTTTVYIWGYDKKYLIARIENATYTAGQPNTITVAQQILINDAVTAATGGNTLLTENNLRDKLQLLRAGFPDAFVSTFTHDPLIGITSMTDPKGYTTFYEYDSYGRLKQVKDKEGKVLSSNNYHYKNQ